MAAGDVTTQLVENATTSTIEAAVAAMRNGVNDKWLMTSINDNDVIVVNIEEA